MSKTKNYLNETKIHLLRDLASRYNTKSFISEDPVKFPNSYTQKQDIEISALISSWIAYGNRKQILQTLTKLHSDFDNSPYNYIKNRSFDKYANDNACLYRFYTNQDYYQLCNTLHNIYCVEGFMSLEDKLLAMSKQYKDATHLLENLISLFPNQKGIPQNTKSACKRLCLLLRWLIRQDHIVDLGIWNLLPQSELLIPLDTHVFRLAKQIGLTDRNTADMKTVLEITQAMKEVFPTDVALGDFALFGYGVSGNDF